MRTKIIELLFTQIVTEEKLIDAGEIDKVIEMLNTIKSFDGLDQNVQQLCLKGLMHDLGRGEPTEEKPKAKKPRKPRKSKKDQKAEEP